MKSSINYSAHICNYLQLIARMYNTSLLLMACNILIVLDFKHQNTNNLNVLMHDDRLREHIQSKNACKLRKIQYSQHVLLLYCFIYMHILFTCLHILCMEHRQTVCSSTLRAFHVSCF